MNPAATTMARMSNAIRKTSSASDGEPCTVRCEKTRPGARVVSFVALAQFPMLSYEDGKAASSCDSLPSALQAWLEASPKKAKLPCATRVERGTDVLDRSNASDICSEVFFGLIWTPRASRVNGLGTLIPKIPFCCQIAFHCPLTSCLSCPVSVFQSLPGSQGNPLLSAVQIAVESFNLGLHRDQGFRRLDYFQKHFG